MPLPQPFPLTIKNTKQKKSSWQVKYMGKWHNVLKIIPPTNMNGLNSYQLEGLNKPIPANKVDDLKISANTFNENVLAQYQIKAWRKNELL